MDVVDVNERDSAMVMQDLALSYAKHLSTAETQTWHRRVFQFMSLETAQKTADKVINESGLFGRQNYFPTIPFFLEVSRSITGNATLIRFPKSICDECQNDRWVEMSGENTFRPCSVCKSETYRKWADGSYYKNPGYGGKIEGGYVTKKTEGKENLDVLRYQISQLSSKKSRRN